MNRITPKPIAMRITYGDILQLVPSAKLTWGTNTTKNDMDRPIARPMNDDLFWNMNFPSGKPKRALQMNMLKACCMAIERKYAELP